MKEILKKEMKKSTRAKKQGEEKEWCKDKYEIFLQGFVFLLPTVDWWSVIDFCFINYF